MGRAKRAFIEKDGEEDKDSRGDVRGDVCKTEKRRNRRKRYDTV